MLNIGRLAPGAADYYVGEVATSAEDYYTGHGEAPGRWVGSLAAQIGLAGQVDPENFRAVLDGRHPFTGEQLAVSRNHRSPTGHGSDQATLFDGDRLDVARAAARLHLSIRHVRRLLFAGSKEAGKRPDNYLRGTREGARGNWAIERSEIERFEAMHLGRKTRPGYDLTLRPPKSVSILWALADEPTRLAIRQAHSEAVDRVIAYMESHALYARKRASDGRRDRVMTFGVTAAAFDHRTSRAGDPLLHTHVVTANLTKTVEGRWQAIDGRPLFDHARPAGMLYQVELRHLLTERLGVAWTHVRNGWAEIEGVPREVVRAFSKRRDEIEAMVAESGYSSPRAHQTATLSTRKAKDYGVDPDHLVSRWRKEAETLGFGPEELAACFGRVNSADSKLTIAANVVHRVIGGPEGLTKHASTFTRKEVVEAACDLIGVEADAADVERIVDEFLDSDHAVPLHPDLTNGTEWVWRRAGSKERDVDLARWTTPDLVRLEGDLHRWSDAGFGTVPRAPDATVVDTVIDGRPSLNGEQTAMVRALASPAAGSIQPVSGRPGSGKTYATATYVRALVGSGVPVVGCALAATAAAELEDSCRFGPLTGTEATTIARLLRRLEHRPLAPGAVVIVDEASMVGTRDLHRIATHVAAAGGSLKLIGDEKQHGAVETGGFFKLLVLRSKEAGTAVELEGNNRQQDANDRAAIDEFRDGLVEAALARYDTNGHIHRAATADAAYQQMVDDWADAVAGGGLDPMIAGPNRVRRELNRRARITMTTSGRLTGPAVTTADGVEVQAGDWIVTRRNEPRLRSKGGGWVKNGSAGTVVGVDPTQRTVTVAFHRDGRITLPAAYLNVPGQVEHGYARTTYGVQGATLDRALYFAGDEASFEEGYVAFSRGRLETRLYLVDGTALADDDTSSRAHAGRSTGLDTVASALGRERANALVFDADPTISEVRAHYDGWRLDELRAERLRIEAVLRDGPPDVSEDHDEAAAARDALLAQRRAVSLSDRTNGRRGHEIDRALERVDRRLAALAPAVDARTTYLAEHPDEVAEYPLVRRAELARELQLRAATAVAPPHAVLEMIGASPVNPVTRRAWSDAAEAVAVHRERYGTSPSANAATAAEAVLGPRPTDLYAGASWDRAADALDVAAQALAEHGGREQTANVELELPTRVQPELSLLD